MFHAFFPEILALIPIVKVEFHCVLVVALKKNSILLNKIQQKFNFGGHSNAAGFSMNKRTWIFWGEFLRYFSSFIRANVTK